MLNSLSRRKFLNRLGAVGGSSAIYQASLVLGLIPSAGLASPLSTLKPLTGKKRKVVILGAGISGLASTYELERAGYECTLIEASNRMGGRNLTLRAGDRVDEMGYAQQCEFDDHPNLYFNAGPARILSNHRLLLHYCKILGVELEVFVGENRQAWVHDSKSYAGKPVRMQEYITDARGFMTELLAKSTNRQSFDASLSKEDTERLFEFLQSYGDLNEKGLYKGSSRIGMDYKGPVLKPTFDLSTLLNHSFWKTINLPELLGAPILQMVGGNDRIVQAFVERITSPIITSAPVQQITLRSNGVDVVYQHQGRNKTIHADYCLNSIPSHLLPGVHNNFPKDYLAAMGGIGRGKLMKIGLQMSERFWERENIFGGMSYTDLPVSQLWYPSQGIHDKKGVMLGAYTNGQASEFFTLMTPAQRIQEAVAQGANIHPGYADYVESGISVPWHRMKYMMGCEPVWTAENKQRFYHRLQQPEGRHYLMGDQISDHPGWQEGALSSAHFALADLNQRVSAENAHHA